MIKHDNKLKRKDMFFNCHWTQTNKKQEIKDHMNRHEEVDDGLSELGTGVYVTELGPHDVLLGRGTGPNENQ